MFIAGLFGAIVAFLLYMLSVEGMTLGYVPHFRIPFFISLTSSILFPALLYLYRKWKRKR